MPHPPTWGIGGDTVGDWTNKLHPRGRDFVHTAFLTHGQFKMVDVRDRSVVKRVLVQVGSNNRVVAIDRTSSDDLTE